MPKISTPRLASLGGGHTRDPSTIHYPRTALERSTYRHPATGRPLTAFQWRLYDAIKDLKAGQTSTYKALADELVSSPRAVGTALSKNPFCPLIPCHRILASDGKMGGFSGHTSGGLVDEKVKMLLKEGVNLKEKKPGVWALVDTKSV